MGTTSFILILVILAFLVRRRNKHRRGKFEPHREVKLSDTEDELPNFFVEKTSTSSPADCPYAEPIDSLLRAPFRNGSKGNEEQVSTGGAVYYSVAVEPAESQTDLLGLGDGEGDYLIADPYPTSIQADISQDQDHDHGGLMNEDGSSNNETACTAANERNSDSPYALPIHALTNPESGYKAHKKPGVGSKLVQDHQNGACLDRYSTVVLATKKSKREGSARKEQRPTDEAENQRQVKVENDAIVEDGSDGKEIKANGSRGGWGSSSLAKLQSPLQLLQTAGVIHDFQEEVEAKSKQAEPESGVAIGGKWNGKLLSIAHTQGPDK